MFSDRRDAGAQLAEVLAGRELVRPLVLALPRGGVPVGYAVAEALDAPLDVLVARKIGVPSHAELGVGAIAEGGEPVLDHQALASLGLTADELTETVQRERAKLARRVGLYHGDRPLPAMADRDVILVDDGLATGGTAVAAVRSLRGHAPRRVILAVPVAAPRSAQRLRAEADDMVCLHTPRDFAAVGQWYREFPQTSDETVVELLDRHRRGSRKAEDVSAAGWQRD